VIKLTGHAACTVEMTKASNSSVAKSEELESLEGPNVGKRII
jgi:hypothetical protein